jgi:hypothetical protein
VRSGPHRFIPAAALALAVLGTAALMVSPTMPMTLSVAAWGVAGVAWGCAVLIVGVAHGWW